MDVGDSLINCSAINYHMSEDNKENLSVNGQQHQDFAPATKMSVNRSFGTHLNPNSVEPRVQTSVSLPVSTNTSHDVVTEDSTDKGIETNPLKQRKRRERTTFSKSQINFMNSIFLKTKYPDSTTRENISKHTGIPEQRIQVWFKNRRAKGRKYNNSSQAVNDDTSIGDFSLDIGQSYDIPSSLGLKSGAESNRPTYEDAHVNLNTLPVNLVNPIQNHLIGFQNYVGQNNQQPNSHFDATSQSMSYAPVNTNQIAGYHPGYFYRPINCSNVPDIQNHNVPNMYVLNNPSCYYSQLRFQNATMYRPSSNNNTSEH